MDISPYLRKPLRSLQEVVEILKPGAPPETATAATAAAVEPECPQGEPLDPPKT